MTRSNIGNQQRQPWGMPTTEDSTIPTLEASAPDQTGSVPSRRDFVGIPHVENMSGGSSMATLPETCDGNLSLTSTERILAAIAELRTQVAATDRRVDAIHAPPHPPPAPPFPASSVQPLSHIAPTITQPWLPPSSETSGPARELPQPPMPQWSYGSYIQQGADPAHIQRPAQPITTPDYTMVSPSDRPQLSRTPGVRRTSCWGPPNQRAHFGSSNFEQQYSRMRMDPPRFDGNDPNNWIFRVQYYFDHVGVTEADRLHYVVMLFDPPAADWIWNYCTNNEYITWHEFLDDVRHRFDPDCYENYLGLLSKLT